MPGLDLTGVTRIAEALVFSDSDQVRLTRDGDGDPVYDTATRRYVDPPRVTVYEGRGAVLPPGVQPTLAPPVTGQTWVDNPRDAYRLITPVDAPVPTRDQQVQVIASEMDPSLVGRTWRCVQPGQGSSFAVLRITWLDELTPTGEG